MSEAPAEVAADIRTVLVAALEALEDNDVDGAERILRTALKLLPEADCTR